MRTPLRFAVLALAAICSPTLSACGKSGSPAEEAAPHIPASSDPAGKDIVEGAVVAAREQAGGIRLYKVTHVEDYPEPIGFEYHMIAYDPTCDTYERAATTWKKHEATMIFDHLEVRQIHFLPRDHRVLFVEPLTDAERATYTKSVNSRGAPMPMPMLNAAPHP